MLIILMQPTADYLQNNQVKDHYIFKINWEPKQTTKGLNYWTYKS